MNDYPKIPNMPLIKTDVAVTCEVKDKFVDFYEYCNNNKKIYQEVPAYYKMKLPGSVDRCYMRSRVADLILEAAQALPPGMCFRIYDAWRPFQVQEALFNNYRDSLSRLPDNQGMTKEQLHELTTQFVSYPSDDCDKPFAHSTGGAVDLTIVNEAGAEINMGTKFDDFTQKANTAYYEAIQPDKQEGDAAIIRDNRRLLYNTMTGAGFTNLPTEWWHYDYGDRFWSNYSKKPAFYKGVLSAEDLLIFKGDNL